MENDKEIQIEDGSGDKDYFTMVPNYVINHSTAIDQSLYLQMKRYGGERGKCFATEKTLMRKLNIGKKSFDKSLTYLIDHSWIEYIGLTPGKTRPIKTYRIKNIWKLNSDHYEEIYSKSNKDKFQKQLNLSPKRNTEEDLSKEKPLINKTQNPWSFEEKLSEMEKEPGSYLDVIATFIRQKKLEIENPKKLSSIIVRHCRDAKLIANGGWTNREIFIVIDKIKEENRLRDCRGQGKIDWTVGTIWKYLTK